MADDFTAHVTSNPVNRAILSRWHVLDLPGAWLVAAVCFKPPGTFRPVDARLREQGTLGPDPRLLFVAHRQEILKQSLHTFRWVAGTARCRLRKRATVRPHLSD